MAAVCEKSGQDESAFCVQVQVDQFLKPADKIGIISQMLYILLRDNDQESVFRKPWRIKGMNCF